MRNTASIGLSSDNATLHYIWVSLVTENERKGTQKERNLTPNPNP